MVEDLIVEGEVITGDDVDASIFLDLPMGKTQAFAFIEEVRLGELSTPIGLGSFLEVPQDPHSGEAQNRTVTVSNPTRPSQASRLTISPSWLRSCGVNKRG